MGTRSKREESRKFPSHKISNFQQPEPSSELLIRARLGIKQSIEINKLDSRLMQGVIEADGVTRNPPSHHHAGNPDNSEESNKYRLRGKRVKYTDFDDTSDHSGEEQDALKIPGDGNRHDSDAYYSAGETSMDDGHALQEGGATLSPRSHRRELRYGILNILSKHIGCCLITPHGGAICMVQEALKQGVCQADSSTKRGTWMSTPVYNEKPTWHDQHMYIYFRPPFKS